MDPLFALGLGATALVSASIFALHKSKLVVPRYAVFRDLPELVVDPALVSATPARFEAVRELEAARADLEGLGWRWRGLTRWEALGIVPPGVVYVTLPDPGRPAYASDARHTAHVEAEFGEVEEDDDLGAPIEYATEARHVYAADDQGWIVRSVCRVNPDWFDGRSPRRIFRHELSHGLGMGHCETPLLGRRKDGRPRLRIVARKHGHAMHPSADAMGDDMQGMEIDALRDELHEVAGLAPVNGIRLHSER